MSSHQRKTIRDAVVAQLAGTSIGANIFANRARILFDVTFPVGLVYTREENAQTLNIPELKLLRKLALLIEIYAEADESLDDTLDTLSAEIEDAMKSDDTFGGTAQSSVLTRTEMDLVADGEVPIGVIRLNYEVSYIA